MLLKQHDFKSVFESGEYIKGIGVRKETVYYVTITYYPSMQDIYDGRNLNIKLTVNETDNIDYSVIDKTGKMLASGATSDIWKPLGTINTNLKKTLKEYVSESVADYIDIIATFFNLIARKLAEERKEC